MNRHRIWKSLAMMVALVAMASGCMAPPPRPAVAQRGPDLTQKLASSTTISPYGNQSEEDSSFAGGTVVKVGLLLPLSGRNAELGKALRDAASVSLFDKYARLPIGEQTIRVELMPKDTGDSSEQAAAAMNAAIAEGASFIIGPLYADAVAAAAPAARAKNISVLSLSNTRTQASPGTYMFGFSPAEQADRVVTYALSNGKLRVAVLVPNSPLGETVLAAARDAAKRQGVALVAEAKYLSHGNGMESALNSLVKAGERPRFDAILIPEGGQALDTILRGLSTRGVRPANVKFLGTGLWDDAELLRRVNLESAWLASSPPELTSQFEARFRSTYKYAPPRIASLSYDAVALAVTLATSGRAFDTTNLTNPSGYAGPANGIFRLRADGITQRGLAVMEVKGGALTVISPSPKGF